MLQKIFPDPGDHPSPPAPAIIEPLLALLLMFAEYYLNFRLSFLSSYFRKTKNVETNEKFFKTVSANS